MAKFIFIKWLEEFLLKSHSFVWDLWNREKISKKHGITPNEAESCFNDLKIFPL